MASFEGYQSKSRLSYWIRHVRLSRLIGLLLIILIIVPLIAHYYLSNIGSDVNEDSHKSRVIKHIDEEDAQASNLKFHVSELKGIKSSVSKELRDLESQRQKLRAEIRGYHMHIEKLKNEYETTQKDLEKVKVTVQQVKVEYAELSERNMPEIHAPRRILPNEDDNIDIPMPTRNSGCRMHTCFDYSRCSLTSGFPVYIYDLPTIKLEFESQIMKKLLMNEAFSGSPYITEDGSIACIYVVVIGPRDFQMSSEGVLERKLRSLSYWRGDGRNHVLLNLTSSPSRVDIFKGVNTGRALIAQSTFRDFAFREKFDIVLPPLVQQSSGEIWKDLAPMAPLRRKYLMSFIGEYIPEKIVHSERGWNRNLNSVGDAGHPHERFIITTLKGMETISLDKFYFQYTCENKNERIFELESEWSMCGPELKRFEVLQQSTFSLILAPRNTSILSTFGLQLQFFEALKHGVIPVLVGDHIFLPYHEILDWRQAAIIVPSSRITELHFIIRTLVDNDLFQYRYQGRLFYETYLSRTKNIMDALFAVLRTRLQIPPLPIEDEPSPSVFNASFVPLKSDTVEPEPEGDEVLGPLEPPFPSPVFRRNYTVTHGIFNQPGDPFHLYPYTPFEPVLGSEAKFLGSGVGFRPIAKGAGGAGKEFNEALGGNVPREQFTIVMLTYEREAVLISAVARLKGLPFLNKVVVVWNSPKKPSEELQWPDVGVPVHVIKTARNSLNNRFLPYSAIETEAILSIDDDAHLRHDEIVFGFRVWREARDRVVGFPGRFHAWDTEHKSWHYNSNYSCELSMVLTGAAFFHKYYAYLYSYTMPQAIRDKVDEYINCEDIAMNFLVSHITRKPPIKVTSRWTFRCPGCPQALSVNETHFQERHKCVDFFVKVYGYMPLLYTQFRVDSVLFKTRIPHDKQKCFRFI